MQIDEREEQIENRPKAKKGSRIPDSNATALRERHASKQSESILSTETGMQIRESDEQL
jgi:hypothetical protein